MILIRKATQEDSERIATCLLLAMQDIIYKFIASKDPQEAKAFMLHFVATEHNQYSWQNCWVAEQDGLIAGAVDVYDGAQLKELRQPVIDYIRNKYHTNLQPEEETQAGEYYIDSLGVLPDHQNKGIGSQLLHFLVDEYAVKQQRVLGLLVDEENPNAKRLYLQLGFTSVGKKTLLGKQMEHLQLKR